MKIDKRKVVMPFVLTLLMTSLVFVQVSVAQIDEAYIDPPEIHTNVCENFTVTVIANVTSDVISFDFILNFDPTKMSVVDVTAVPPWAIVHIEVMPDYVWVGSGIIDPPIGPGSISLVEITFHCDASGTSNLWFQHIMVEPLGDLLWQGATVHQWYFKASYEDYAPSGVLDFDQRQDNWNNSAGAWTWCGPLAVANSLWWFDSKFEPSPVPPPTINDGFPLVTAYGAWDDHDPNNVEPFVNDLAWLMDTDGQRTGSPHSGTKVTDMEVGIRNYLANKGLDWMFSVTTVPMPPFEYIEEQVEKSEDVVILLGFWQDQDGEMVRVGGHFVTVAGVHSADLTIAFSDPIKNNAELGSPGRVIPPPPHPHNPAPPFPLHNNATYVSHDSFSFGPSPSPGGSWGPEGYELEGIIENFIGQNTPEEFEGDMGPYDPANPMVFVEVEYAVIVSPIRDVAITDKTLEKTVVGQNYTMFINVTGANEGAVTETFDVTTYYSATVLSEGFESGNFAGWDFYYSTNGEQNGSIAPGTWNSSIVSGASALSGSYSARLFADCSAWAAPWRVDAAINRTINKGCASILRATLKFDDIQGSGGIGHSYFAIDVFNALNKSRRVFYGFSTTGDYGDISYTVSPGDLVNFERNIVTDYFNKYNEDFPNQIMIRFLSSADYAEGIAQGRTTNVTIDDISIVVPSTPIETETVTLTSLTSTVITFEWNTTGVCKGNYTISAYAWPVQDETDTTDNTHTDGWVMVGIPGDVNGLEGVPDGIVNVFDVFAVAAAWLSTPGDPNWNPNCDFSGPAGTPDKIINIFDVFVLAKYWLYGT